MQRSGDDGSRSSAPSGSSGADITTEAAAGASAERSLAARLTSAGGMSDIERLLALQQQQRQQQQQSHLSSSLSGLLAQQRLQQLQQPQGLAGLNTLALLQRQHQEQLLAEQLGFAHGLGGSSLDALNAERLLASRAGLGSHQHQLFGALGQGLPSGLGVELTRSAGIVPGLNSFASITRAEQEPSASDEMGKISATGKLKKADNSDDEAEKEDDIDSAEGNDDEEEGRSKRGQRYVPIQALPDARGSRDGREGYHIVVQRIRKVLHDSQVARVYFGDHAKVLHYVAHVLVPASAEPVRLPTHIRGS